METSESEDSSLETEKGEINEDNREDVAKKHVTFQDFSENKELKVDSKTKLKKIKRPKKSKEKSDDSKSLVSVKGHGHFEITSSFSQFS